MKAYIIVLLSAAILSHLFRMLKRISKGKYIALVNLVWIFAYVLGLILFCVL